MRIGRLTSYLHATKVESMKQSTIISDPDCPKCQKVMNWHSVQEAGTKRLNVFHCESCNTFAAAPASEAPTLWF